MKLKIGLAGISGRIGQKLINILADDKTAQLQCGLVSENSRFTSDKIKIDTTCGKADIWIDFSTPQAFEKVLTHCIQTKTPFVSGTTGLTKKHYNDLEYASAHIPILWASNFAISINLIRHFLSNYTKLIQTNVKITETHHIHKADKPSGTAITLAKTIKPHGMIKRIDEDNFMMDNIEIKSIREGKIAGIHDIQLKNQSENISITHEAKDPIIFAQGALNVAKWLDTQDKGFYTMTDYIERLS